MTTKVRDSKIQNFTGEKEVNSYISLISLLKNLLIHPQIELIIWKQRKKQTSQLIIWLPFPLVRDTNKKAVKKADDLRA